MSAPVRFLVIALLSVGLLPLAGLLAGDPLRAATPAAPAASPLPPAGPAVAPAAAPTDSGAGSGMVTIESDSQKADNRTGIVTAVGNVRITYPERGLVATSRQAQYFSKEGRLVLSGDVDVIDDKGQRIRAERMTYRLDQERLVAEPPAGRQVFSRLRLQSRPSAPPAPIVP